MSDQPTEEPTEESADVADPTADTESTEAAEQVAEPATDTESTDEPEAITDPAAVEEGIAAQTAVASDLADQFQAVLDRLNRARQAGLGALGAGMPGMVKEWLSLLEAATTQATVPITQLEAISKAISAQRQSVQALQSQLEVFDKQLGALESAVKPFAEWGKQWVRLQDSVIGRVKDLSAESSKDSSDAT